MTDTEKVQPTFFPIRLSADYFQPGDVLTTPDGARLLVVSTPVIRKGFWWRLLRLLSFGLLGRIYAFYHVKLLNDVE